MRKSRYLIFGGVLFAGVVLLTAAGLGLTPPIAETTTENEPFQFEEVSAERGFEYESGRVEQKGSTRNSVYVADYTKNGYPDVLALGADRPILFRNTGGQFEESGELPEMDVVIKSALFFDYNNNGWEDLLLLPLDGTPIFLENQQGAFVEQEVGFEDTEFGVPSTATAADYTGNGCLDVFIAQNGKWHHSLPHKEVIVRGTAEQANLPISPIEDDVLIENDSGLPNALFRGDCEQFEDVTEDVGISGNRWTLAASFVDFTGNGYPDIHAGNDFNLDILYVNQNGTHFEKRPIPDTNRHAMSSEVADFSGNERLDIFVTNIREEPKSWIQLYGLQSIDNSGNNLLINTGETPTFETKEREYGVQDGGWGWAAVAVDFDNDGQRDLIHATSFHNNATDPTLRDETYPRIWQRDGDAFTALDPAEQGFLPSGGRGLAALDYNQNGKMDVVLADAQGMFKLYENVGETGNWVQIDVAGDGEVSTIGARIYVESEDGTQMTVRKSKADLQSQSTRIEHLGVGEAEEVTISIEFPNGTAFEFEDIETNQRVVIHADGTIELT